MVAVPTMSGSSLRLSRSAYCLPVDWQDLRRAEAQVDSPGEAAGCGKDYHGLAFMKRAKKRPAALAQDAIDALAVSQSEDESAWEAPFTVKRSKPASLSIPGDLAARAAFLARLHREAGVDKWVERIVRERVELEEFAFNEAKRKLAS